MIVPSYTDERILLELMDDWPGVKRKAKKLGEELLKNKSKRRMSLDKNELDGNIGQHRSKNGNTWHVSTYCYCDSKTWWSVCYCEVEKDRGTKSYYFDHYSEKVVPLYS